MKLGTCSFDQVAKIGLGYKSLQNQFFYLSSETVHKYGIEARFLKPLYQLDDLDSGTYKQKVKPIVRVFYCKDIEKDLHGTGALKYIRAMENVPATARKQASKPQTIQQALEAQTSVGGTWYMPKAILHKHHIWLRKAVGTVFSPFLFDTAAAVDQRCNFIEPAEGVSWKVLAAMITSSLFVLAAESWGSANLGGGALELATTNLRGLQVLDVRDLKDEKAQSDLVSLAEDVWCKSSPVDWESVKEPPHDVTELDKWLLSRMKTTVTSARIHEDIVDTVHSRLVLASDKGEKKRKKEKLDIGTVAGGVVDSVRPLLESAQFPESFVPDAAESLTFTFPSKGVLSLESLAVMDQTVVVVRSHTGEILLEKQYPRVVAQVIVKALLTGRRTFTAPSHVDVAQEVLSQFDPWFHKVVGRIEDGCAASAVGTSYEQKVHDAVMAALHLNVFITVPEFYGKAFLSA